jgi:hypothetical protein
MSLEPYIFNQKTLLVRGSDIFLNQKCEKHPCYSSIRSSCIDGFDREVMMEPVLSAGRGFGMMKKRGWLRGLIDALSQSIRD